MYMSPISDTVFLNLNSDMPIANTTSSTAVYTMPRAGFIVLERLFYEDLSGSSGIVATVTGRRSGNDVDIFTVSVSAFDGSTHPIHGAIYLPSGGQLRFRWTRAVSGLSSDNIRCFATVFLYN